MQYEACPKHFEPDGKLLAPTLIVVHDENSCPAHYVHINDWMGCPWGESTDAWKTFRQQVKLKPKPLYQYNVHFTRNPKFTLPEWWDVLKHTLKSKQFTQPQLITMEHLDKNVHVHFNVHTKNQIDPDKFKSFTQNHIMKITKVSEDHGIDYYFNKENKAFTNISAFKEHYDKFILKE